MHRFYFRLLIAFTIRSVRLSALALLSDTTAQMAAGIQPISVICKIRQRMPVRILPLSMKESQGNNMARSVINQVLLYIQISFF